MRYSWTISRYLLGAVLPYFVFSWLLLSVILFVQQAGRFSDIFFSVNIPSGLIWQLTFALLPNVIAFTCPMAALVGVIIGLAKMQTDSELTAIRAAGVGNLQIALPFALLGLGLSAFALITNLFGVPLAARIVRQVATQTAIYKLESPIEPGVFNTEIAGFTLYVRDGDITDGRWKNIFIHNEDEKTGITRLITSRSGRIDFSGDQSELVLENAVVTTVDERPEPGKLISERVGEIRYAVKTRRGELIEKLRTAELTPEELGLAQLSEYAGQKEGKERIEADILWQRRILLSLTPFLFCLLGTALMLGSKRRG
ncbi:MAG: LptF/LptG family permease, partial [Acidobacteria bacterium]|nr:LptF/LptG family permease [Acidobacteriota bacterium]MCA1608745.1 LptF/LptG family permease [Acidobacteriota bacterium]